MKLQHMVAMAEGYTDGLAHDGELDFFFRHGREKGLTYLKITLLRHREASKWVAMVQAQEGEEQHEDTTYGESPARALAQIMERAPAWCKL